MLSIQKNGMFSLPTKIKRDLLTFSFPLFLISSISNEQDISLYWSTFIGCLIYLILLKIPFQMNSKMKMTCSSILFILQIFYSKVYFLSFGFILYQAYDQKILLTKENETCNFITKIEIIGWLCSELFVIPKIIQLILGSICLFISFICELPCIECKDPFNEMKKRIEIANLVNAEYRQFIKGNGNGNIPFFLKRIHPFLFEILYLLGNNKLFILFCSFFSLEINEFVIFGIGLLSILNFRWEPLLLILKGSSNSNVIFRVGGTCISLYIFI